MLNYESQTNMLKLTGFLCEEEVYLHRKLNCPFPLPTKQIKIRRERVLGVVVYSFSGYSVLFVSA